MSRGRVKFSCVVRKILSPSFWRGRFTIRQSFGIKRLSRFQLSGTHVAINLIAMIKTLIISIVLSTLLLSSVSYGDVFYTDGIETHLDVGCSVLAPFHFNRPGFGYNLSVVMRPDYARYMFDSFEKMNLGLTFQSVNQYLNSDFAFRDVCFTVRYYLNRKHSRPGWQSAFIGAGAGIAKIFWDTGDASGREKDIDYLFEAGYELDYIKNLTLSVLLNLRVVDIEPVSYTGMGLVLSIGYGIEQ